MSYTKNSSNYHDYMDRWYSNSYEEYMDYRYWQEEQKKKRWYNRLWAKLTAMASWFDNKKGYAPTPGKFVPIFDESIKLPEGSYYPHPVKGSRWVPAAADDLEAHVRLVLFTRRYQ